MSDDQISVNSNVRVTVIDPDGVDVYRTHNVTCIGGHEAIAQRLAGDGPTVASVAVGNDGASGTSSSNRSLNNQLATVPANALDASGNTLAIRAFVPSLLQLGAPTNPLDEVGAVVSNGDLLNHATIDRAYLSGTDTVLVVDITITISNA